MAPTTSPATRSELGAHQPDLPGDDIVVCQSQPEKNQQDSDRPCHRIPLDPFPGLPDLAAQHQPLGKGDPRPGDRPQQNQQQQRVRLERPGGVGSEGGRFLQERPDPIYGPPCQNVCNQGAEQGGSPPGRCA